MREILTRLLFYYFSEQLARGGHFGSRDATRPALEVSAGVPEYGRIVWATAAAAAVSSLLQPGYSFEREVVVSNEVIGPVFDTLAIYVPFGLLENVVPTRGYCTPENIAAHIVAKEALQILQEVGSAGLSEALARLISASWIGRARYCLDDSAGGEKSHILKEALGRIELGLAPRSFRVLTPFIETLLEGDRPGSTLSRRGELFLDVLAELETLASILDALEIEPDRGSYLRRKFRKDDGSVIVCYQAILQLCELRPDIVVFDANNNNLVLVEVKSSAAIEGLDDKVWRGVGQLLTYREAVRARGLPGDCTDSTPHDIRKTINIKMVLSLYTINTQYKPKCVHEIHRLGITASYTKYAGRIIKQYLNLL